MTRFLSAGKTSQDDLLDLWLLVHTHEQNEHSGMAESLSERPFFEETASAAQILRQERVKTTSTSSTAIHSVCVPRTLGDVLALWRSASTKCFEVTEKVHGGQAAAVHSSTVNVDVR